MREIPRSLLEDHADLFPDMARALRIADEHGGAVRFWHDPPVIHVQLIHAYGPIEEPRNRTEEPK